MSHIFFITFHLFLSLSILVVLHELGHFLAAKYFGTKVEKFYLFFNPWFSLFKKKIGETEYGIGWLPLGGYVKISGMIDESMDKEFLDSEPQPWEFRSKPAWQRLIIMLAGVIVNVLLAIVIYIGLAYFVGDKLIPISSLQDGVEIQNPVLKDLGLKTGDKIIKVNGEEIKYLNDLLPKLITAKNLTVVQDGKTKDIQLPVNFIEKLVDAKDKGAKGLVGLRIPFIVGDISKKSLNKDILEKGDQIVAVNGNKVKYYDEISPILKENKDKKLDVTLLRGDKEMQVALKTDKDGRIGVAIDDDYMEWQKRGLVTIDTKEYSFIEAIPAGVKRTKEKFLDYIKQLKMFFTPKTGAYKAAGGFIAIAKGFPDHWDWTHFWDFTAFLSIMLAVVNILPIPALDGGHAMFTIYEMITGRKPGDKFMEYAQMAGFLLLITLVLLVNGNDIIKLFK